MGYKSRPANEEDTQPYQPSPWEIEVTKRMEADLEAHERWLAEQDTLDPPPPSDPCGDCCRVARSNPWAEFVHGIAGKPGTHHQYPRDAIFVSRMAPSTLAQASQSLS